MAEALPGSRARPLSPHLLAWRWHVTLAASILHRLTGAATYLGMFLIAGWALALASGRAAYGDYMSLLGSIPGKIVLFAMTMALFFHLAAGVRHLAWDMGAGFPPRTADATAWGAMAFAAIASVTVWVVAAMTGAL